MTLTELFAAIAAAIRSKDGTTASIPATTFPERIMAISGSGGGGGPFCKVTIEKVIGMGANIPVTISASVSTSWDYVYTHALYNGVRLPMIPKDVLASYPYAWIRKNTTSGYYDLLLSDKPFYYQSTPGVYEANGATGKPWYRVSISGAATATAWTNNTSANTYTWWGLDSARTVMWSNHDIPNGSATATDIYFEGTDPVPTL